MSEPTASLSVLKRRAALRRAAREFFDAREILEVETNLLGASVVVESHLEPIHCQVHSPLGAPPRDRYLLTSPEGPMKQLLAAGSGPIYQFAPAFRDGEVGPRHAPEFTILEWYRPGFDHHQLMDEVAEFTATLLPEHPADSLERKSYRELFLDGAGIDPFATNHDEIAEILRARGVPLPARYREETLDDALDLVLVNLLEPNFGRERPLFVTDYPASQAALAKTREEPYGAVGERFELYIRGVELANGYHELADPDEQRRRLEAANRVREESGRPPLPIDEGLIAALAGEFPPCAGVALGFDRLVMVAVGARELTEVRAFPFE